MRRLDLSAIKTRKDFNDTMRLLEVAWSNVSKIQDSRKRAKEIIKLRKEVQTLLHNYKRENLYSAEKPSYFRKIFNAINDWLGQTKKREKLL
jgi:hypothetical protein